MMNIIHKFEVSQWAVWELPVTALFLSMQVQRGVPVAWFLYDTEHPKVGMPVIVIGTGHEIADVPGCYIGTYQDGGFVGHVFLDK